MFQVPIRENEVRAAGPLRGVPAASAKVAVRITGDPRLRLRDRLDGQQIHVFGIGGTATLHLAALLRINSTDSSGWRNRAARGLVQLPGGGDRTVAELGNWRGRKPSPDEWDRLEACGCPACQQFGLAGLKERSIRGGSNRATHNLWVLLQEARWIEKHLSEGTYPHVYQDHLDNTIYLPLIDRAVELASATS
jgi:7-cyano-7-deazaguanine tRNA-ribosyltransferase